MSNQATQPPPLPGTLAARPPQSIEAEQAVLGAMLLSKEAIDIVVELLEVDYFYRPAHRKLFKAIVSLYEKNEPVDLITVADELTAKGWLKDVGGRAYLAGLAEASPSVVNVAHHARIVADKAARNLLCRAAETMLASANDEAKDIDEILDLTEQQVFSIKERKLAGTIRPMEEILYDVLQNAENAQQHGAAGLSSGFADLDRLTSGFQKADLIIIDTHRPHLTPMYHPVSHLVYAARGSDVRTSIINGRLVMENGRLVSLDVDKIMADVNAIAKELASG